MNDTYHRRSVLWASSVLTITTLTGCATLEEKTREARRGNESDNDSKTKDRKKSMSEQLEYTVYQSEVGDIITSSIASTADCEHGVALATSEDEVEMFNWEVATKEAERFARKTDFSNSALLAVKTTSSSPIIYKIDKITRLDNWNIKAITTAKGVPGPSTPDVATRLARVQYDKPTPQRVIVLRDSTDPERNAFEYASDDNNCPKP